LALAGVFDVREGEVSASSGPYKLTVRYSKVSRAGLATPWEVEVRRPGGIDRPFTISTTQSYFELFDTNGLDPQPAGTTSDGEDLRWRFDPPGGDTFRVFYDARLQPTVQSGDSAATSLIIDDRTVATVRYRTRVMP
jgi:hypothetical protein